MLTNRKIQIEIANTLSHGFGIILAMSFSPLLIAKAYFSGIPYLAPAVCLYILGVFMVFISSTAYHAATQPFVKFILRKADHISIFFLIGGTYFPLVLLHAEPKRAVWLLSIQWIIILAGILHKLWYTGKYKLISSLIYIGIGMMILGIGPEFWEGLPDISLYLLIAGGISYIVGVFFYQKASWIYHHFIWHLFVLAAAIMHFLAVYFSF